MFMTTGLSLVLPLDQMKLSQNLAEDKNMEGSTENGDNSDRLKLSYQGKAQEADTLSKMILQA